MGRIFDIGPYGLFHFQPMTIGFQSPFQHPFRFILFGGNKPNGVFIQALWRFIRFNIRYKPIFIFTENRPFNRCQLVIILIVLPDEILLFSCCKFTLFILKSINSFRKK